MVFRNRSEAGRLLAERLGYSGIGHPVVLGLPRGGVAVAYEVAAALHASLDVLIVRKLGLPFQPEMAMGAIGEDNVTVLDKALIRTLGITAEEVEAVIESERNELNRRSTLYRGLRPPLSLAGRSVLIVDDGVATGATMKAACRLARAREAVSIVIAAPVAAPGVTRRLRADCDEMVFLRTPSYFSAVGQFYRDFEPVSDPEVGRLLDLAITTDSEPREISHQPPD